MKLPQLPPRTVDQSLDGYVLEHLQEFERQRAVGVPYRALLSAALAAGFSEIALVSLRTAMSRARKKRPQRKLLAGRQLAVQLQAPAAPNAQAASEPEDDEVRLARRFRQLVRSPAPGTDEKDLLV
jgi:hypothetical protein